MYTCSLDNIFLFDDPNTFDPIGLTDSNVLNRKDTKIMPVNETWTHYVDCRPFSRSQNVGWQNTNDYSSVSANTLTAATTMMLMKESNSAPINQPPLTG